MKEYQTIFLNLALDAKALEFGSFTLKSGRTSPYFFNAAKMLNGDLYKLAKCYQEAIDDSNISFDFSKYCCLTIDIIEECSI